MSATLFPEFFVQCCDAMLYLDLGRQCAEQQVCSGDLRPGGAYYWFSWPVRLGLSNDALIYANLLLLVVSSLLSTQLLFSLCARAACRNLIFWRIEKILLLLITLAIHLVFFWPTIFTALSDPAATLFLLSGIWLLGLSCVLSKNINIVALVTGSFCIGLAAWIRAFYLYPLLLGILAGIIAILFNFRRDARCFLLLISLIMPGLQLANSFQQSGNLSYIDKDKTSYWSEVHMASASIGYDTVFPSSSYFYRPQYCEIHSGLFESLSTGDYSSILCLVANRIGFYLATYRATNYIYADIKNRLFFQTIEDVGLEERRWPGFALWIRSNLDWQHNIALDPRGDMTADKMTAQSEMAFGGTAVQQSVPLPGNKNYTFSVWLWSDKPTEIQLSFSQQGKEDAPLSAADVSINSQPRRVSISGKTNRFGHYTVKIGSPSYSGQPVFGSSLSDSLYAWGAQLEEGTQLSDYAGIENLDTSHLRDWHLELLLVNVTALIMALLFVVRTRKIFLLQPAGVVIVVIIAASFAEALVIIPEQRFAIAFMVFMWSLASAQVFFWLINRFRNKTPYPPAS